MSFGIVYNRPIKTGLRLAANYQGNVLLVDLYTDVEDLANRENVIGDFTLADYPGYVQQEWDPATITTDDQDRAAAVPALVSFPAPTSGEDVTVLGYVVQYWDGFEGGRQAYGADSFAGGAITLSVGDPDLTFGIATRAFDAHKND